MTTTSSVLGASALVRETPPKTSLSVDQLKQAAQARKAAITAEAWKARTSPRFEGLDSRKSQARAKLQQLGEWMTIVRKLHAQNPQGMAKALAQAFKELKAAVQAYKDAGGEEMGLAGGAVTSVMTAPPAAPAEDGEEAATADAAASGTDAAAKTDDTTGAIAPTTGAARYDAVVGEVRKMIGEDELDFLKSVRALVKDMRNLLDTARGQAAIRKRDKDTDHDFEDADAALKDLGEAMSQMERQLHTDAPMAGLTLSVAA